VQFSFLLDDVGVPLNYRHMEGFGVHTFMLLLLLLLPPPVSCSSLFCLMTWAMLLLRFPFLLDDVGVPLKRHCSARVTIYAALSSVLIMLLPLLQFSFLLDDVGVPLNYRHMEGFGVHTFMLLNKAGRETLVKFHWKPSCGKKETCGLQMGLVLFTCPLLWVGKRWSSSTRSPAAVRRKHVACR
jgi:hypothetical protein